MAQGFAKKRVEIETKWQALAWRGRGFAMVSGFITIPGTAETDFVLLRNPAGSGHVIVFEEILFTINGTSAQSSRFLFYRSPNISSPGTPITVSKVQITGAHTSIMLAYQLPTIVVGERGTLIQPFSTDFKTFERDQKTSRFIYPGSDVLITATPSNNNIGHNVSVLHAEVPI